jgi:RNA chaperone Hfq
MNEERTFYADLVNRPVRVYLVTGIRLKGTLLDEYERAIVLADAEHGTDQLLYKHSITTVAADVDARSSRRPARPSIRGNPGPR